MHAAAPSVCVCELDGWVGGMCLCVCVWRHGRAWCAAALRSAPGPAIRVLSGFSGCVPHAGQPGLSTTGVTTAGYCQLLVLRDPGCVPLINPCIPVCLTKI